MFHKPYFIRYRQALEQSLSSSKTANKASENAAACTDERAPVEPDQNQHCAVEEQSNRIIKDSAEEPASGNVYNGFEQIAPGIFKFSQPSLGQKGYAVPPSLFPPFHSEQLQIQKASEFGFKRVDGLQGPYQNYSTPVFQFT